MGGIVEALAGQDIGQVLIAVAQAVNAGADPRRLASDLLDHLRNTFLAVQAPSVVGVTGEALSALVDQAHRLGLAVVVRAMELVGLAIADMRDSVDTRINLEVALVRLISSAAEAGPAPIPAAPRAAPGPVKAPAGMDAARAALGAHRAQATLSAPVTPTPPSGVQTASSPVAPPAAPIARPAGKLPSRDELTKAWGDIVLPKLPPSVRVFLSSGRFTAVEGSSAVYALPNRVSLQRAEPVRADAEEALSAHFGARVPLKLVLDDWTPGSTKVVADPEEDDLEAFDAEDLEDAGPELISVEQRLLEAFPGAEEVKP
ncbi:MAG: hypothetical protein ACRDYC_01840 [Acidimicrobiales bacterium]